MPIEITLNVTGSDTTVTVPVSTAPQSYSITLPDSVTSIEVDPNLWILKTCQVFVGLDELTTTIPYSGFSFVTNPTRKPVLNVTLSRSTDVRIFIYDVGGRLVNEINAGDRIPGSHEFVINGLRAGVYFCRLKTDREDIARKVVVID